MKGLWARFRLNSRLGYREVTNSALLEAENHYKLLKLISKLVLVIVTSAR